VSFAPHPVRRSVRRTLSRRGRAAVAGTLAAVTAVATLAIPTRAAGRLVGTMTLVAADDGATNGLVAGGRFAAWLPLGGGIGRTMASLRPATSDRIEVAFPPAFTPGTGAPRAYFLAAFRAAADAFRFEAHMASDRNVVVVTVRHGIAALAPTMPSEPALYLSAPLRNPATPGTYRLSVRATVAGRRSLRTVTIRVVAPPRATIVLDGGRPDERGSLTFAVRNARGAIPAGLSLASDPTRPERAVIMADGRTIGSLAVDAGTLVPEEAPRFGTVRVGIADARVSRLRVRATAFDAVASYTFALRRSPRPAGRT
jgi:hypothetical protein